MPLKTPGVAGGPLKEIGGPRESVSADLPTTRGANFWTEHRLGALSRGVLGT